MVRFKNNNQPKSFIMESINKSHQQLIKIGAVSGILSIIFYFSVAVISVIPDSIAILIAFAFPLLWIISFMGLYHFLKNQNHTATLEIAYLFGIIGSSIACTFLVIQQANFIWDSELVNSANYELKKEFYNASFRGANRVQAGMDVAFDIFITISWILFGLNIAKSKNFNKLIGWSGSIIALGLLVLNMFTFPNAPAESGLFDLGPFLGIWALIFYIWFTVIVFKQNKISN
jgi:hypothetical protein